MEVICWYYKSSCSIDDDFNHKVSRIELIMSNILFNLIDWTKVERTEHRGESGIAYWRTLYFGNIRMRLVEYSENYIADHWCQKGHIVHCLEGEFVNEMANGERHFLSKGMTYIVSDDLSSHRSLSKDGVSLLVIDGDFLNSSTS